MFDKTANTVAAVVNFHRDPNLVGNTDRLKYNEGFHLIWTLPPCFCCHFLYLAIASKKLYLKSKYYVSVFVFVFGDRVLENCISKVPPNLHICCRHQQMQV